MLVAGLGWSEPSGRNLLPAAPPEGTLAMAASSTHTMTGGTILELTTVSLLQNKGWQQKEIGIDAPPQLAASCTATKQCAAAIRAPSITGLHQSADKQRCNSIPISNYSSVNKSTT
jgi:hypothetical protein